MKKKLLILSLAASLILSACGAKNNSKPADNANVGKEKVITLATTTSTEDSGLLKFLLPEFKKDTGIDVKVVSQGTGQALETGKRGDADCLLVHAKAKEEEFVKEEFGVERIEVMYNDFIMVGPKEDPVKLKEKAPNDPKVALKLIEQNKANFISRGDESGTHVKEKALWKASDIEPKGDWYISAGKGMGAVLQMADEKNGYTLTDRATYLSMKDKLQLEIVTEKNKDLYNQYGVIVVNPKKHAHVKEAEANEFVKWITSEKGQKLIGEFGKDKYGESLFIPNAKK
ncbi:extracellular solute-binding protein [Clostridium malenominatum]|uniref:Extracellular solute-binding protein n=1 Tax=Clostridium malenominatum TaxID=1539 RepID=A0ABN1J168_9CLOT